jgi:hypothetical protein
MSRILIAVVAFSVLGYLAYRAMYGYQATPAADVQAPTDRLQNVREAAKRIEAQDKKQVEDIEQKTQEP